MVVTQNAAARLGHSPNALCVKLNIARRLIVLGARAGLVHRATHLPWRLVAALHRDLHGEPPPRGQMRHSCAGLVASRRRQILSSTFAVRFLALAGRRPRSVGAAEWLQAYEEWRALTPTRFHHLLSINDAWRIAEDLRLGAWGDPEGPSAAVMRECSDCGRPYLVSAKSLLARECPYCYLLAQSNAWRQDAVTAAARARRGHRHGESALVGLR
jgi:hypothetical protein